MDFEKTHKPGNTLSNFPIFQASKNSFKKTDNSFNQTKPIQKYQIKINKLQKKAINLNLKKNDFIDALSELKNTQTDQNENGSGNKNGSLPYLNLLLLRPNEQNKPPFLEKKKEEKS